MNESIVAPLIEENAAHRETIARNARIAGKIQDLLA